MPDEPDAPPRIVRALRATKRLPRMSACELARRLAADEPPAPRALLGALLGIVVVKDLMVYEVPARLLMEKGEMRLPWFAWSAPLLATPGREAAAFGAHVLAFVCAILLMLGRWARPAALYLAVLYGAFTLVDQLHYTNNVVLLTVLLCVVAIEPLHRPSGAYARWIGQALITTIYLVGSFVKLDRHWLSGETLGAALMNYHFVYKGAFGWKLDGMFQALAIGAVAVEGFVPIGLWFKQTRHVAILAGTVFHLIIELVLPVRMFGWLMIASYALFVPADELGWFERWRTDERRRLLLPVIGVGIAVTINAYFSWLVRSWDLTPKNQIALGIAVVVVVAAAVRFPTLRRREERERTFVPRSLRLPIVVTLAALEIFAVAKPRLGAAFTNRFGWRMFTEVVRLKVEMSTYDGEGWAEAKPDAPWDSSTLSYQWDSLSEQRALLGEYAQWVLHRKPETRAVRLVAIYERNGEPPARIEVERWK